MLNDKFISVQQMNFLKTIWIYRNSHIYILHQYKVEYSTLNNDGTKPPSSKTDIFHSTTANEKKNETNNSERIDLDINLNKKLANATQNQQKSNIEDSSSSNLLNLSEDWTSQERWGILSNPTSPIDSLHHINELMHNGTSRQKAEGIVTSQKRLILASYVILFIIEIRILNFLNLCIQFPRLSTLQSEMVNNVDYERVRTLYILV